MAGVTLYPVNPDLVTGIRSCREKVLDQIIQSLPSHWVVCRHLAGFSHRGQPGQPSHIANWANGLPEGALHRLPQDDIFGPGRRSEAICSGSSLHYVDW